MGHSVGEETQHNFHQLFSGIAQLYDVEPERMTKMWEYVDAQAQQLELPLLPNWEWLRFNTVLEIGNEKPMFPEMCILCEGTGKNDDDEFCDECDGMGWIDPDAPEDIWHSSRRRRNTHN